MESVILGNLTLDINSKNGIVYKSPGGSSFFCSLLLSNLGSKVTVVSPFGADFPRIDFKSISFIPVKPGSKNTLVFKNIYAETGLRSQKIEHLESANYDSSFFERISFQKKDLLFIAPILNNLPVKDIKEIMRKGTKSLKVLLPQGLFREIKNNQILPYKYSLRSDFAGLFDIIVVSEKDCPNIEAMASVWGQGNTISIVTRGADPAEVYFRGAKKSYPAFKVEDIRDETGAGDIFAAAFAFAWFKSKNIATSAYFAHAAAALSLPLTSSDIKYSYQDIIGFAAGRGVDIVL